LVIIIVTSVLLLSSTAVVSAHPGRTAADGCHYCRTSCDQWGVEWNVRHCHNEGTAIETVTEIPAQPSPKPTSVPVPVATVKPTQQPSPKPTLLPTSSPTPIATPSPESTIAPIPTPFPTAEPVEATPSPASQLEDLEPEEENAVQNLSTENTEMEPSEPNLLVRFLSKMLLSTNPVTGLFVLFL